MMKSIFPIIPYTLVGPNGLEATYKIVKEVCKTNIPGDIVELGVARGGCAALMASVVFNEAGCGKLPKKLWLFDSYEGLPEPTENDFDPKAGEGTGDHLQPIGKGSCLGTLDEVRHLFFVKNNYPQDRIEFVKGWFEETVPKTGERIERIAVLRVDGDWYESTKCSLEGFYDRVDSKGFIIIDDYQSCFGCQRAADEFFLNRNIRPDVQLDGRGGCYFRKI